MYSVSMFKRHTLEGCGYLAVPNSPTSPGGTEIRDISTWKPVGDHISMLNDFYLGGGVHLTDMACIGVVVELTRLTWYRFPINMLLV